MTEKTKNDLLFELLRYSLDNRAMLTVLEMRLAHLTYKAEHPEYKIPLVKAEDKLKESLKLAREDIKKRLPDVWMLFSESIPDEPTFL